MGLSAGRVETPNSAHQMLYAPLWIVAFPRHSASHHLYNGMISTPCAAQIKWARSASTILVHVLQECPTGLFHLLRGLYSNRYLPGPACPRSPSQCTVGP